MRVIAMSPMVIRDDRVRDPASTRRRHAAIAGVAPTLPFPKTSPSSVHLGGPCHCHARWTPGDKYLCSCIAYLYARPYLLQGQGYDERKKIATPKSGPLAAGVIVNKLKEASSNRESEDVSSAKKKPHSIFLLRGWPKGMGPAQKASIARLMTTVIPLLTPSSEYGSR